MLNRLRAPLLTLRLSIFLVMLMWTLDKFVRPSHASAVFENFYFSPAFGPAVSYCLGGLELLVIIGFVIGYKKCLTYSLVTLFHGISTISSYQQYLDPFGAGPNLLFFAAWPMLAACYLLLVFRKEDTLFSLE